MPFIELRTQCTKTQFSVLEEMLFALDALSISLMKNNNEILIADEANIQPLPENINLKALFAENCDTAAIEMALRKQINTLATIEFQSIADNDWQARFRQEFEPIIINENPESHHHGTLKL